MLSQKNELKSGNQNDIKQKRRLIKAPFFIYECQIILNDCKCKFQLLLVLHQTLLLLWQN